jgi:hypothetical protein
MDFLPHLCVIEHPTGNYIVSCLAFLATTNAMPPQLRSQSPSSQHDCIPRVWWRSAMPVSAAFIAWRGQLLPLLELKLTCSERVALESAPLDG